MKRPPTPLMPRAATAQRRAPRNRTEAAVELVRVEFDAARLERERAQAVRRATAAAAALTQARQRAASLARLLRHGAPSK